MYFQIMGTVLIIYYVILECLSQCNILQLQSFDFYCKDWLCRLVGLMRYCEALILTCHESPTRPVEMLVAVHHCQCVRNMCILEASRHCFDSVTFYKTDATNECQRYATLTRNGHNYCSMFFNLHHIYHGCMPT